MSSAPTVLSHALQSKLRVGSGVRVVETPDSTRRTVLTLWVSSIVVLTLASGMWDWIWKR